MASSPAHDTLAMPPDGMVSPARAPTPPDRPERPAERLAEISEVDSDTPAPPGVPVEERLREALGADYELGAQIGAGGMGIVFKAFDRRLRREVAIKVLAPEIGYRADLRKRFVREAQMAAGLAHPNLVPIHDVGRRSGLAWFVMTFVHGESVRDLIRRTGAQPIHVVARVLREIAMALSYAHARGVVHRDIKPDNIMIERGSGRAILMDFGLAKNDDGEDENLTHPGGVVGTPAYMSPEQARGRRDVDHRTDIFSLGMVGYYMLTGRNPWEASNARAVMARVMTEEPPSIGRVRPDVPTWLADAIARATHRDIEKRFEKAELLAEALDRGDVAREIPSSVHYMLVWAEAYIELSILAAWFLFIVGMPDLPLMGGFVAFCLLSLPILFSLHLVNAEGLRWPEIREAIVAWRLHMLRCMNLKRESGIHPSSIAVVLLMVLGAMGVRLTPWTMGVLEAFLQADWNAWTSIDTGALSGPRFFTGPTWALWYALLGSLLWSQLFGLPRFRRLSPQALDKVASWRLPGWIDALGGLLFARVWASTKVIEATADFRQLAEPAVQAAIAFHRTKRSLPLRRRLRLAGAIRLGELTVKRLWRTNERLQSIRECVRCGRSSPERHAEAIERRETLLAECAGALTDLRQLLEESTLPPEDRTMKDERVLEELRRLAFPLRMIALGNAIFVVAWLGLAAGWIAWFPPMHPLHAATFQGLVGLLAAGGLFQLFKRRIYT